MNYPTIFVLRHGETEWNAESRWQGVLDSPLTERGRDHARSQRDILGGLELGGASVRVSPQGRAMATAEIVLGRSVEPYEIDDRLREIDVGDWTGRKRQELVAAPGPVLEDTPDGELSLYEYAPNGEGFAALRVRCEAFLAELTGPTICITHGITSRMLRIRALARPARELGGLPGGQGVVHVVDKRVHRTLPEGLAEGAAPF